MTENFIKFLNESLTSFHTVKNVKELLLQKGFQRLSETEDWALSEGGKYFVVRADGSLIAFTIGDLDDFSYKIVATHSDSPALKIKENPLKKGEYCTVLNAEPYGGGIWYSFFDRPLKIAGRVVTRENGVLRTEIVEAPFLVTVPSVAIHQNRGVNDGFAVNAQTDLQPLFALTAPDKTVDFLSAVTESEDAISYDLFLVNTDMPYTFGVNGEFLASPRIDNLSSVFASFEGLTAQTENVGICVAAMLDNEEIGSATLRGAGGDFLETTLRRIAYAFRFDDNEFFRALSASFLLSVDNAHAVHPNHPEKSDPTNRPALGGGVVVKHHAGGAYITDALSSAIVKTLFDNAGVRRQSFFNRSDVKSGSTLGAIALRSVSMHGADIGLAQLAMHSACECIAKADYDELVKGLTAFFAAQLRITDNGATVL